MMNQNFTFKRRVIIGGVTLLLLADVALGVYRWRLSTAPSTPPQLLAKEKLKLQMQEADIAYAEKIATNFPKTVKDCDKFEHGLPSSASISSTISAELGDISKKSGVQLTGITFKDKEHAAYSVTEREMDASVSGQYENVVKFLNGLQKSPNFYVVDSLELGTESNTPNQLRVGLHMRTFFRTAGS
ncbi:MAG: type 4a pilus biogenesis protein PilO [Acidobacteria bacterium]|nr:type 4a pilus biogenesis protein PilO [Acidobacteriota bacterium]MBS1866527.1 type 4a pilus biogenesis protein PilO [Acidobacteriota bacterium]